MKFKVGQYIKHRFILPKKSYEIFKILNLNNIDYTAKVVCVKHDFDRTHEGKSSLIVNYPEWENYPGISEVHFSYCYDRT